MSVYGRKRKTEVLFSYVFDNGAGHKIITFDDYRGISNNFLVQVKIDIEESVGKQVAITNWKILNERT